MDHESQKLGETHLRKMQDNQAQRQGDGNLRESKTQTDPGMNG
jgi:hypothetical protein